MPEFSVSSKRCALAIFCRAPRLGTVKTRLAASRGDEFALELYRAMLGDSFSLGGSLAPQVVTFACFTPDDAFQDASLSTLWDGPRLAQRGGDLGARMLDCLGQLQALGYERCVLIGSDSPDLPTDFLQTAFEKLSESDVVVGPSADGGFYLIGTSTPLPDAIFRRITWSSERVYSQLLQNLTELSLQLSFATLPEWRDIDDDSDLREFGLRMLDSDGGGGASKTRAFMERQRE